MKAKDRYVIILQNEKLTTHKRLALALAAANLVPFLIFCFFQKTMMTGILGIACFILYFVVKYFLKKKYHGIYGIDEYIFFLMASVWLLESGFLAVLLLLTGLLFKLTLQKFRFIFTPEGISKDFFPKKKYDWDELEFVILKAGMLTMDFKNNRLLQGLVVNHYENDEQEFNAFVRAHLKNQ